MASERQIAANRANAQKSTGPTTLAGKLKSGRNALKHGLSCPLRSVTSAKARGIAQLLAGENPSDDKLAVAVEFAQAQLELQQIRAERAGLLAKIDINRGDPHELRRLVSYDRYERYAHTRRRRALGRFEQ
jgi:hypothetical protein